MSHTILAISRVPQVIQVCFCISANAMPRNAWTPMTASHPHAEVCRACVLVSERGTQAWLLLFCTARAGNDTARSVDR